ncbi:MAG: type II toxin-antitoxin system prevent-host-death family antitoxin [Actinomycetaceae bacterium]|nr:type II toxin-antitoxin system prevent-host-death family antitoxin [Actinomycetaceae bacterium]
MQTIAHRELRNNSSEILRRVAAGESFEITNNGVPTAMLIPTQETELDRLRAAGQTRPPLRPLSDLTKIKRVEGLTSKEVLDDLRGDR